MPENHFDGEVAARYDETSAEMFGPEAVDPVVAVLAELAGDGAALELAIGTGRIALPLAARGVPVRGIELSEAMVAELRRKPGGRDIEVAVGDMTTTRVDGAFSVVYLVFNTINNLTSQDAQVACFENAARHLGPGGTFVVEVGTPPRERHAIFDFRPDKVGIDEIDAASQSMVSHHYRRAGDGRFDLISVPFRYVWPAELDLMARIAGLRLRHRWGDWDRSPFTHASPKHVSVWESTARTG